LRVHDGAWCNPRVIRSKISPARFAAVAPRVALLLLAVAAGGALAGCSASVSTKPKDRPNDDWDASEQPTESRGPSHRNVSGRPPTATYPGFHVIDDSKRSSVVLVEVSREVDVKEMKGQGRIVYVLSNTNVPEKVNRLPLLAEQFGTVVSRISLEQVGSDAHLIIETRGDAATTHRVVPTDNGINVEVTVNGEPRAITAIEARGPYQKTE
jgi:hypothetical protein